MLQFIGEFEWCNNDKSYILSLSCWCNVNKTYPFKSLQAFVISGMTNSSSGNVLLFTSKKMMIVKQNSANGVLFPSVV